METRSNTLLIYVARFPQIATASAAIITALVTLSITSTETIPVFSSELVSISAILITMLGLVGFTITAIGYRLRRPHEKGTGLLARMIGRVTASLIIGLLVSGAAIVIFYVLTQAFIGVSLDRWIVILLATGIAAIVAYGVAVLVIDLSTTELFMLGVAALVVGLAVAMLTSPNPDWYDYSLSYLGAHPVSDNWFNASLILTGLAVFAVVGDLIVPLRNMRDGGEITPRAFKIMHIGFIVISILVGLIGVFHSLQGSYQYWIHQGIAGSLFILIGIMEITVPRIAPVYPQWFKQTCYVFFGITLSLFVIHGVLNLINFPLFEMLLISSGLVWLFIFSAATNRIAQGDESSLVSFSPEVAPRLNYAIRIGLLAAVITTAITFVVVNPMESVPISSPDEISADSLIMQASVAITLIVAAFSYRHFSPLQYTDMKRTVGRRIRRLIFRILVSLVMALLALFISFIVAYMLNNLFIGARLNHFVTLTGMFGISFSVGSIVAYIASKIELFQLWVLMGATALTGLLWAMTQAANPYWWENAVSHLSHDQGGNTAFRGTVMLVGLLMIAAIEDLRYYFGLSVLHGELTKRNYRILLYSLYAIAIFIFMVGLFPTVVTPLSDFLHNVGAVGFSLTFIALTFIIGWLLPFFPTSFKLNSVIIGVLCIADFVGHYALNLYNFVALQLILFALIGVWIYLFEMATQKYYLANHAQYEALKQPDTEPNPA